MKVKLTRLQRLRFLSRLDSARLQQSSQKAPSWRMKDDEEVDATITTQEPKYMKRGVE